MTNRFRSPRRMLCFSLILCAAAVHADAGGPFKFSLHPRARAMDLSLAAGQFAGSGPRLGSTFGMVLAGMAGNVVGLYAGGFLGSLVPGYGEGIVPGPALGALAGSACGSALGVYLAGSGGGRRGSFGAALGGSMLGELAAVALVMIIPSRSDYGFLTGFLILPPIGAALFFNSSLSSRSVRAGSGIVNLAAGRLGMGVPDVHIRPVTVPGGKSRAELQLNVRVLSVEL